MKMTTWTGEEPRTVDMIDDRAERPREDQDPALLEYLRANGVRVGRQALDRPRVIGRQRRWWVAVAFRTLRRLHLVRD